MILADRIKERMDALELTQAALARQSGVSQQSISRLVSGEAMGSRYLHKIAAALRTTPAYLTGETEDPGGEVPDDVLSGEEQELVEYFRRLTTKDRAAARQIIRSLANQDKPTTPAPTPATLHSPGRSYAGPRGSKEEAA